jgi:hypothetical protein
MIAHALGCGDGLSSAFAVHVRGDPYGMIISESTVRTWAKLGVLWIIFGAGRLGDDLLLARRHALPPLHPPEESGLSVPDGAADPDVGRAVAAHARLGQPGQADLHKPGCFLGGEQHHDRRGRLLRHRAAGERRLRCHFD